MNTCCLGVRWTNGHQPAFTPCRLVSSFGPSLLSDKDHYRLVLGGTQKGFPQINCRRNRRESVRGGPVTRT